MLNIIIVDDHPIFVDSLAEMLAHNDYNIVGKFYNGESFLESKKLEQADILLLDISLPGISGIDIIQKLKRNKTDIKVIVLSSHTSYEIVSKLYEQNIDGYVSKSISASKLLEIIKRVSNGEQYFSEMKIQDLQNNQNEYIDYKIKFGDREFEIINLLLENNSTAEISKKIFISENTVKYHKKNIYRKLAISSKSELIALSKRKKII